MASSPQQICKTPLPKLESAPISEVRDIISLSDAANNGPEDNSTNTLALTPVVTISAENLQAMQE